VVGGDLGGHRRRVAGVQAFQGPRHPPVGVAAPGRAEAEVGDLPDPVVGEVVGVGTLVADQAAPPQLVEGADQLLLAGLAGQGEGVGGELPPDGGGHPDQVAGRAGELGQPGLDHDLDPGGDRGGLVLAPPAGPQRLDHEQRVALGVGEQAAGLGLAERVARQPLGQGGRLLLGQPSHLDLGDPVEGAQPGDQVVGGMAPVQLLAPGRGHHQQGCLGPGPEQVVEELQGLPVGPVEVVGDQQEGPGRSQDRPGQGLEQPAPIGVGRGGGWWTGPGRAELGQQACELDPPGRVEPAQVPGQGVRAQPGHHRPVGERPLGRVGAGLGGGRPGSGAPGTELFDQPGLAGAGSPVTSTSRAPAPAWAARQRSVRRARWGPRPTSGGRPSGAAGPAGGRDRPAGPARGSSAS
jgi:hypothetical protein